ncbi:WD repeat-containing protein 55 [Sesamum angolense]|uniref:WD repeat-containing protein 55 n=1 Tax=Sesamum angolense TaxID=2727404 RepID=A0AAE2BXT9_9LAMI|nr:WD repeat-containing protein 55 [Sesamum angolense]
MEIDLGKLPFDLDFHPSDNLVAAGLITGQFLLYRYAAESTPQRLLEVNAHTESCRALRFVNEGRAVITGSPDCSILATDTETGTTVVRLENSHEAAVNRIVNLTESTIASGDDEGCIKVQTRSEFSEDELLSVVIMKNGRKVICGTQTGTLLLYSWGFFKDCSDRFVDLSPNSVDALLKLDEDRVITGSENGIISLVGILPNRIIQPIAEHSEYPVERLAFSHDRKFLGSISHDQTLKLWDLEDLLQGSGNTMSNHSAVSDSDSDGWMLMIVSQNLLKVVTETTR